MISEKIWDRGIRKLCSIYTLGKTNLSFFKYILDQYMDDDLFIKSIRFIILTRTYKNFPPIPVFLEAVGKKPILSAKETRSGASRIFLGKSESTGELIYESMLLQMSKQEKINFLTKHGIDFVIKGDDENE
jgi:hypothetical protein